MSFLFTQAAFFVASITGVSDPASTSCAQATCQCCCGASCACQGGCHCGQCCGGGGCCR